MFTISERSALRDRLIQHAEADPMVAGAALVGSAAREAEDEWSDIDLVLQLAAGADERLVVEAWTSEVTAAGGGTADTLDVFADGVRYRVFLLRSSLQVDLSFWPYERFRSSGEPFKLLFGNPAEASSPGGVNIDRVIGMGWLYAIHARSAVARGRLWQAAGMLDELRGTLLTLKCARAGLQPFHGRQVDQLPAAELDELHRSHPAAIARADLDQSRCQLTAGFLREVARHDAARADRLSVPFNQLVRQVV